MRLPVRAKRGKNPAQGSATASAQLGGARRIQAGRLPPPGDLRPGGAGAPDGPGLDYAQCASSGGTGARRHRASSHGRSPPSSSPCLTAAGNETPDAGQAPARASSAGLPISSRSPSRRTRASGRGPGRRRQLGTRCRTPARLRRRPDSEARRRGDSEPGKRGLGGLPAPPLGRASPRRQRSRASQGPAGQACGRHCGGPEWTVAPIAAEPGPGKLLPSG